jgi:diaminopimelate decarboxylase
MRTPFRIQGQDVAELASRYGTPMFLYDGDALEDDFAELRGRLHPSLELFFSLKSNPNVSVCALLHAAGARAEVSSYTELMTARWAGVDPEDIIFLGPGKSSAEIEACLDERIYAIVVESLDELAQVEDIGWRAGRRVPVMLRVNPSFEVKGSGLTMGGKPRQFGIDEDQLLSPHARSVCERLSAVRLIGVHAYMGTRILDTDVVAENTARIFELAERVADALAFDLRAVDVGGGLGVAYFEGEDDPDTARLAASVNPLVETFRKAHPETRLMMELGRYLTARCGMYLVRARHVKESFGEQFVVADGGMNHHMAAVGIGSFVKRNFPVVALSDCEAPAQETYTITGPLCTPGDTLAKKVGLPLVRPGDLLGVARSGAYGPTASPGLFLSHGYPAEVLVHGGYAHLVRERDEPADLLRKQRLLPLDHDLYIGRVATANERKS